MDEVDLIASMLGFFFFYLRYNLRFNLSLKELHDVKVNIKYVGIFSLIYKFSSLTNLIIVSSLGS